MRTQNESDCSTLARQGWTDTGHGLRSGLPAAFLELLAPAGVEMSESLLEAGRLLVAGTLSPGSRLTYGSSLGCVSRWCAEHGLDLLGLSPVDVGAVVVACRDAGVSPKSMLAALSFVYRNKPEPVEGFTGLARRVDRVWRSRFRDRLRPTRRAVVLPLRFWQAAHGAVHRGRYAGGVHPYDEERYFRDRFILSLGVSAGLRPGEFGLLSASGAHIAGDGQRLVLPLIAGSSGATTKTGRSEIVVPLGVAPFDVFPLVEDFEALRRFRLRRVGEEDTLVAAAWGYGLSGGLTGGAVEARLREAAQRAGLDGAMLLSGGSLRRSMVHIAIAAGWSLERVAAVTGHATTVVLEQAYLDGYAGVWCRSSEGRQMLLDGVDGWADWPPNVAAARPGTDREPAAQPWWQGRDIDADRATAVSLVRGTPRVAARTSQEIARVGRLWEAFCARVGANPAQPSGPLIEAFCLDLTRSGSSRYRCVLHLTDHLAVLPSTDIADVTRIQQWAFAAVRLGEQAVKANRLRERRTAARREIVPVTDDAMNAIFSFPLVVRPEGVRLVGLVLKHAERVGSLTSASRGAFRFGEHANVRDDVAELSGPPAGASRVHSAGDMAVVCTVRRHGTDPLWCPYEAVRRLVDHYPDRSLRYDNAGGDWAAHCTSLIRWLQSRAAVAGALRDGSCARRTSTPYGGTICAPAATERSCGGCRTAKATATATACRCCA